MPPWSPIHSIVRHSCVPWRGVGSHVWWHVWFYFSKLSGHTDAILALGIAICCRLLSWNRGAKCWNIHSVIQDLQLEWITGICTHRYVGSRELFLIQFSILSLHICIYLGAKFVPKGWSWTPGEKFILGANLTPCGEYPMYDHLYRVEYFNLRSKFTSRGQVHHQLPTFIPMGDHKTRPLVSEA
jgi:hypothetical protein